MAEKFKNLALVILAAGNSQRMGSCKQLLPWKNSTLIDHAMDQALKSSADQVYVVLGAHKELITKETGMQQVHVVFNPDWVDGMGSSISIAVQRIQEDNENFEGVLLTLVDQPLIELSHYNNLINRFLDTKKIVATKFDDTFGVPAVFPKKYFHHLIELQGAMGAKSIIQLHSNNSEMIVSDNAVVDLDTPEEYQRCFDQYGHS